jgi:hypothetical protein
MHEAFEWLLLSTTTGKADALRVFVWRHLRKLGAIYVGQSVCLLPKRPTVVEAVQRTAERVRAEGGSMRILTVQFSDPADEESLREQQRADRDIEYAEVLDRVPAFLTEIETETKRGRATYTEVEESEADLDRFDRWMASIQSRDYFHATGRAAALAALDQCRQALAAFEAAAIAADTTDSEEIRPTNNSQIRAVEEA